VATEDVASQRLTKKAGSHVQGGGKQLDRAGVFLQWRRCESEAFRALFLA